MCKQKKIPLKKKFPLTIFNHGTNTCQRRHVLRIHRTQFSHFFLNIFTEGDMFSLLQNIISFAVPVMPFNAIQCGTY